jgi:predicted amino acid dehydrogenase
MPKTFNYKYDKQKALNRLISLESTSNELVRDDVIRTKEFLHGVFEEFENSIQLEQVSYAFVIPTRASRFSEGYWQEVYDFFPALRHMNRHDAFVFISSIPPFRIEMYGQEGQSSSGVLIFAPIFSDMLQDFKSKLMLRRFVRKRINETVQFARDRFGVKYVGLGATLPKLTNYGKTIKANVITTTGHAGTTALIKRTVLEVINRKPHMQEEITIGFVGGGAIGLASMQTLAKALPNANFISYDKRQSVNKKNQSILKKYGKNLYIASSNRELIDNSQLIVSAITSNIPLKNIDLSGKVIVDDSQPGSFDRQEVIDCGGELIWVIGEDESQSRFVTRRQGYSYGPNGLHSSSNVWGCEAEVASIAYLNNPELSVQEAVSLEKIDLIDEIFQELGISVAPFQSHGQINE